MKTYLALFLTITIATVASAREYHVAVTGNDADPGTKAKPFKTIQAAANVAQPGDVVSVHAGIYRERVKPPRGNVVYQAARGEKVVITGAEQIKGWERVSNDTWKVTLPNSYFGQFNPFADKVQGEWCNPTGRHTGMVYLNGEWFAESLALEPVLKPAGKEPLWSARVDGADKGGDLFAIKSLTVDGKNIAAALFSAKEGPLHATACADGDGNCVGWIRPGNWLAFPRVDFGAANQIEIVAGALNDGGEVELRLDKPDGQLLGTCRITNTGGWERWKTFSAPLASVNGTKTLYLVFHPHCPATASTTIWAQFPGVNPNEANVEINVRQAVFYPSKPGINHITVRGFELRQAATPWAGAMSEQIGLIGTHWSKGWIIENNHIHHSICTGITLGRYELPAGEMPPATAPGFVTSIEYALRDGWSKERIGSHIVRRNHIHDCGKNAIHGSLGACFSEIAGNEIHDVGTRGWIAGADIAGIKFLGGVDTVIRDNHIYRCDKGLWLDWMAQGAVVTGNLLHDNIGAGDVYLEMQHGPLLLANNILLSPHHAVLLNAKSMAFAHNLIAGPVSSINSDPRQTPYHPAHAVTIAGLSNAHRGDHRSYNNLFGQAFAATVNEGNVRLTVAPKLEQRADGWHLTFDVPRDDTKRTLVTTELLGKVKTPDLPYENPDGSPVKIDRDYFGKKRDAGNPFPGPFESVRTGTQAIKVWPKP